MHCLTRNFDKNFSGLPVLAWIGTPTSLSKFLEFIVKRQWTIDGINGHVTLGCFMVVTFLIFSQGDWLSPIFFLYLFSGPYFL